MENISDSLYLGLVVTFLAASLLGMALLGAPETAQDAFNTTQEFFVGLGGEKSAVRSSQFDTLCLGSGCVPALDSPSYASTGSADSWLESGDEVIGVSFEGGEYAFPLKILRMHSVVNDVIAGEPVAVTYSPYSGVSETFSREVDGQVLEFEHSGKLYNGNMVMRDRETGTLWSQFLGRGLRGDMAGVPLEGSESHVARWSIWKRNHPDGRVLSMDTGVYPESRYLDDPYFGYLRSRDVPFHRFESQIHPKAPVYGVFLEGEGKAYREVHLKAQDLVQDEVGGEPVVLVQDESRDRILAFSPVVNGTELEFRLSDGELVDSRTGSAWNLESVAVEGEMTGAELQTLDLTRSYWFAWNLFHPDTAVYRVEG